MTSRDRKKLLNVAARLHRLSGAPEWLPPVLFMTDRRRIAQPERVVAALPPGAGIIVRDYDAPDRPALARMLARLALARDLVCLIGADVDLAARVGATGVHLPENLVFQAPSIRRQHPSMLITAAAHAWPALIRARRTGCDAALLSPVFATESHPGSATLGPRRFAALTKRARLPVYALGGVDAGNAPRLIASGACGIAAIGAFDA